jgi:hypothetical protein
MLQDLIKDLQSTLKNYSKGLANKNLLVDIPWTMVDGDLNLQRLIFRKDNSLYIVREGEIQESKWEYLPAMSSLVIEIGEKKILMNEVFADGKALILKKDGLVLDFLAFANQNELPDLNLVSYLKKLQIEETNIKPQMTYHEIDLKEGETDIWFPVILTIIFVILVLVFFGGLN